MYTRLSALRQLPPLIQWKWRRLFIHFCFTELKTLIYEEFLLSIHKRVVRALQNMGPLILGIPNNVMDRFNSLIMTGFKVLYMSSINDIAAIIIDASIG